MKEEETQVKKIKASVLAVVLTVLAVVGGVIGLNNVTVKAADPLKVSVDTVDATKGQKSVQVAVNVQNPGNLGGLQLEVTWDKDVLKATDAKAGDFSLADPVVNKQRIEEGFIGYADAASTGKDVSGKAIIITFDVLDAAKVGVNPINVNVKSAALGDDNATPIPASDIVATNGGIKLPEPGPLKVSVDTVDAVQNQKGVEVAVNVENPGNLAGLQFEVTFDPTALKATSAVAGDFKLAAPEVNTEKIAEGFIGYADAHELGVDASGKAVIITFDVLNAAKLGANPVEVKVTSAADGDAQAITKIEEVQGAVNVSEFVCDHKNVKDSDYKVVKEPTYTEEGIAEAVCPDCGKTLTRPVDKLVCEHKNVKDSDYKVVKEPTLAEEGVKEAICPDCGTKLTQSIPKLERPSNSDEKVEVNVSNEVNVKVDVPKGVADNNLTDEEQKAILEVGADTTVKVNVNKVDESAVPKDDKDAIQTVQNVTVAAFIDINVTLQVEGFDVKMITQTASKIAFTVQIPADILNAPAGYVREFNIVRVHNGIAEMLNPTRSGDQLSFASDKFSTYAIVYSDKVATTPEDPTTPENPTTPTTPDKNEPSAPQTGDTLPIALFVLMLVGIVGIAVTSKKRA